MSLKIRKPKKHKETMFYGVPTHSDIAQVVTIRGPKETSIAIETLSNMHRDASHDRQVQIERSMVLAANRAEASVSRSQMSSKEKAEMRTVASKYRTAVVTLRERREMDERMDGMLANDRTLQGLVREEELKVELGELRDDLRSMEELKVRLPSSGRESAHERETIHLTKKMIAEKEAELARLKEENSKQRKVNQE